MQYLKDEIRDRIIDAALDEFVEKGYTSASMRDIAEKAQITVGNIYRYFKSKDDLLSQSLSPIFATLDILIQRDHIMASAILDEMPVRQIITHNIMRIYREYPREFYVLRNGLKGTMYNAYYDNLLTAVTDKIRRVTEFRQMKMHPMIFEIMARNQINAVIYILENAKPEVVEGLINEFFSYSFKVFK